MLNNDKNVVNFKHYLIFFFIFLAINEKYIYNLEFRSKNAIKSGKPLDI